MRKAEYLVRRGAGLPSLGKGKAFESIVAVETSSELERSGTLVDNVDMEAVETALKRKTKGARELE